jgi:hypothetical protein
VPVPTYVAFVDILGFSSQVRDDFSTVLKIYEDVLNSAQVLHKIRDNVTLRIFSDAFLLTSAQLGPLIGVVQGLNMQTMFNDCMVRGGIGFGDHIEVSDDGNLYVVSKALVQAVDVEKSVSRPCVALHDSIPVPLYYWNPYMNPLERGVLYFDGLRIVNPFNMYWCQSASVRVAQLMERFPTHRAKHEWFLRLYEAVTSGDPLVPPWFLAPGD